MCNGDQGRRDFGRVAIVWRCNAAAPACAVEVLWLGESVVQSQLNAGDPVLPFSVSLEDQPTVRISGQLTLRADAPALVLDWLEYPEGRVEHVVLWGEAAPPIIVPDPPQPPPEVGVEVEAASAEDLFPYVYMRPWPRPSDQDLENRFVAYRNTDCAEGSVSFFCALAALKAEGDRRGMEAEAVGFVEGDAPWEGQFASGASALIGPIRQLGAFDAYLRTQGEIDLDTFQQELETWLGMSWREIVGFVTGTLFAQQEDRAWQSLFALTVLLGYDTEGLDELVQTLVMARLLTRIVDSQDGSSEQLPAFTPEVIRDGVWATVILPGGAFPMPPAKKKTREPTQGGPRQDEPPGDDPRRLPGVVPYAIGDLQLVRQRLLRYELGEVSAIENVLRGEQKETTRRQLRQVGEQESRETTSSVDDRSELAGTQEELLATAAEVLAENFQIDDQTQYGPPAEGTATGFVVKTQLPGEGEDALPTEDRRRGAAELARRVVDRVSRRVSRTVTARRARTTLDESEETVVHRFDATDREDNVRGIFRWVDKIYEAWVESYGRRLVLEIFLPQPARRFIASELSLRGLSFEEPISPTRLGVRTFRDISPEPCVEAEEPCHYFADLAARYGVEEVEPPPAPSRVVNSLLSAGMATPVTEVLLPEGYEAATAWVSASNSTPETLQGLVGRQGFTLDPGDTEAVELTLAGETSRVPAGVVTASDPGAPPVAVAAQGAMPGPAAPAGPQTDPEVELPSTQGWVVAVEVAADRSDALLETWQIKIWDAIWRGYRRQRELYYGAAGTSPSRFETRNPLANLEIVRSELRGGVTQRLLHRAAALTGEPLEVFLGEPRLVQFLDQALEWTEMAYAFTAHVGDGAEHGAFQHYRGEDERFTAFLQADLARVLLPVEPGHVFALIYFLAAGMVWDGRDALTPANPDHAGIRSVDLINELKQAPEDDLGEAPEEAWEVRVPTSMVFLQDSSELPRFGESS
ncbi:MAG: hypothetical protein AAGN66_08275 [Acidobacteriota bacterium]